MADFKTMYYELAAKVSDALDILADALREGEHRFMSSEDTPLSKLPGPDNSNDE